MPVGMAIALISFMQLKCLAEDGNGQSEAVPKDTSGILSLCVRTSSFGMSM